MVHCVDTMTIFGLPLKKDWAGSVFAAAAFCTPEIWLFILLWVSGDGMFTAEAPTRQIYNMGMKVKPLRLWLLTWPKIKPSSASVCRPKRACSHPYLGTAGAQSWSPTATTLLVFQLPLPNSQLITWISWVQSIRSWCRKTSSAVALMDQVWAWRWRVSVQWISLVSRKHQWEMIQCDINKTTRATV